MSNFQMLLISSVKAAVQNEISKQNIEQTEQAESTLESFLYDRVPREREK